MPLGVAPDGGSWPLIALAERNPALLGIAVFALLVGASEIGHRLGLRARAEAEAGGDGEDVRSTVGFVTGGMLGLLAFLLGISLAMANQRYEDRRASLLAEANAIGTAWLRAQLVGGAEGAEIQRLMREYAPLRREAFATADRPGAQTRIAARGGELQTAIWAQATEVARRRPDQISATLVTALNEMIDLSLTNRRNLAQRVPPFVLRLLLVSSLLTVGAMGYHFGLGGRRQVTITLMLLLLWTATMVLIVDIDMPGQGRVRIDDQPLLWTIEGFGPP